MNRETKQCQNCKNEFTIEPDDFTFYEKMKVPPPTFCPDCRRQRRMAWRNERSLYKRKCNAPGHNEEMISVFSSDKPLRVYDDRYWWSDRWDPLSYGKEYNFTKPFFQQYRELLERTPLIALSVTNMVNCSYCNVSEGDKDCYLISASEMNEHVMYSNRVWQNKDSMDIYIGDRNELCYDIVNCVQCHRTFFSFQCNQCTDSAFLYSCTDCHHCFGCTNLKSKSYYIFNKPYIKKDYEKKIQEIDLGSFDTLLRMRKEYEAMYLKTIHRFAKIFKSVNTTGDNVQRAKNCLYCFDVLGGSSAENCKFVTWGGFNIKDAYDSGPGFGAGAEQLYEVFDSGIKSSRLYFTSVLYGSHDVYYSINCHGSSNLFGCYGLRNKEYCILNRQYSKQEYEELIPKIIQHMNDIPYVDKKGRLYTYGEFFPIELSPFAYNETIAQEYFPIKKEAVEAEGYKWKDTEEKQHKPTKMWNELLDHIKDVDDSILREIIFCKAWDDDAEVSAQHNCTKAYKIVKDELEFYRKMNLPLPRLCPNCRHYQRLKQRNPQKLWHRQCQCAGTKSESDVYANAAPHFHGADHCTNEFETSYAPDRKEIVYCEQCYQAEVL